MSLPDFLPLTDAEIADLGRLEKEATPGPWAVIGMIDTADHGRSVVGSGWRVAECSARTREQCAADAALIAAARNALPRLLAERDALAATVGRIIAWTHQYGKALCPPSADSYGNGVRDAKEQVSRILGEPDAAQKEEEK